VDPHPNAHWGGTTVAAVDQQRKRRKAARATVPKNGGATANGAISAADLQDLLEGLKGATRGELSLRLSARKAGIVGELAKAFNELADMREKTTKELVQVSNVVGREGKLSERAQLRNAQGSWAMSIDAINSLIDDLVRPTREVGRVLDAVAEGDLSQKMVLQIEGQPVKGEFARIGATVNAMVDQLSAFAAEVTRVSREVGTEGQLGGQARVKGVSGVRT
jgi:methyl-accepting chemotaxis protein